MLTTEDTESTEMGSSGKAMKDGAFSAFLSKSCLVSFSVISVTSVVNCL
jgi:hypothetical protein